ncbi:hypothetical protein [Streptomyces sp. G45]|uniref:hypothetical protein n=1 Tax=Streptomyces sp. G45 TaxID=3406627 RepID=UPI003C1CE014
MGVPPEDIQGNFEHLDVDGSGYLSKEEFHQGLSEFVFSNAPDAPGNFLLGSV